MPYSKSSAAALLLGAVLATASFASAFAQETKDSSGTNPAVQTTNFTLSNEYRFLDGDQYFNVTDLKYTQPFNDGTMSVRLTVPINGTNVLGDDKFGLGDVAAKFSWVPYVSRSQAFILSTEIYAPTASEDILGTGKWVVAPGVTWANFLSPEIIVAPAYIQNFSIGGDDHRADVNRGDFDLYFVYKPHAKAWWITSDLTISHDFEGKTTPMSWELNFGRMLAKLDGGGAINGYIRPGVGIGSDRPYNFNIEVGISVINF